MNSSEKIKFISNWIKSYVDQMPVKAQSLVMGISGGNIVSLLFKIPAIIPFDWALIGLVVCSVIGIGFGIYPAWRAAQLDPIESLRFE